MVDVNTSADLDGKDDLDSDGHIVNSIFTVGTLAASGYFLNKMVSNNQRALELINRLPGSGYLNSQLQNNTAITGLITSNQQLAKTLLSQAMALEELSPMHILRTLQLTNLIQPFVAFDESKNPIKIAAKSIQSQQFFYQKLLENAAVEDKNKVKRLLQQKDLQRGMFFHEGKIYGSTVKGTIDKSDLILNNAKLVLATQKNGVTISANQILNKYADGLGARINREAAKNDPLMFIAEKTPKAFNSAWSRSFFRYSMEVGYRALDNPVAGFEELLHGLGAEHTGLFNTRVWKTLKRVANVQLGTGGVYNLGTADSLKLMSKNLAKKSLKLYVGYQITDGILRHISTNGSIFDQGLFPGLANIYTGTRIKFAQMWSDHFQGYRQRQEQAAPGSTSLLALMAFPLSGALLGSQYSYFNRMQRAAFKGIESSAAKFSAKEESAFLTKFGIKGMFTPMKRNALIGGVLGGLLTLPFLPGALIGQSSQELKDTYSGKKEVAVRANRFWFFGGNSINGEHIQYFRKGWYATLMSHATDKVRYGDEKTKRRMNPIMHPLSYLRHPYQFEEMHQQDMPYPVWGMDVSYGSFLGKIFEKTIGRIIKPDVINPKFLDYVKRNNQPAPTNPQQGNYPVKPGFSAKDAYAYHNQQTVQDVVDKGPFKGVIVRKTTKGLTRLISDIFYDHEHQDTQDYANTNNSPSVSAAHVSTSSDSYTIKQGTNSKDARLIDSGLMLRAPSPIYTPMSEGIAATYSNLVDFTGIKGWFTNLSIGKLGFNLTQTQPQLARSGEATNLAHDIKDANLGDLLGFGEVQRKLIGTSSDMLPDRVNPMSNNMPDWLPHDQANYYLDFSKGNPYALIANGEQRLPGKGLEALYPELKGINPKDYPLIYQYKVLADVAKGSKEEIDARQQLVDLQKKGQLNNREQDIFSTILDQNEQKAQRKTFYEDTSTRDKFGMGVVPGVQSKLWETLTHHIESPLEMLTPIRPAAKLLHHRTAIQDYVDTQLGGTDAGIWTNPWSQFIKPTFNKLMNMGGIYKPQEAIERDNINEYFDKLKYIKATKSGNMNDAQRTVIGSSYNGLNTKEKILKFQAALTANQKDYFQSFSKETDESKRHKILELVPEDIGRAYQQIWANMDIANKALKSGANVETALANEYHKQTGNLVSLFGNSVKLDSNEKMQARANVQSNTDWYANSGFNTSQRIKFAEDDMIRSKIAAQESAEYVNEATGIPSSKFIGWDPRLTVDDIKIRTLSVGHEDLKRFGFWKDAEARMDRMVATAREPEVVHAIDKIKRSMAKQQQQKHTIDNIMFKNGFKTGRITITPSSRSSVIVRNNTNNN